MRPAYLVVLDISLNFAEVSYPSITIVHELMILTVQLKMKSARLSLSVPQNTW